MPRLHVSNQLKRVLRTATQKRSKLLGSSVLQLAILLLILTGGITAVLASSQQLTTPPITKTNVSAEPSKPHTTETTVSQQQTAPPEAPMHAASPSTPSPKPTPSASNTSTLTAQYEESHARFEAEQAKYNQCNSANTAAGQKYSAAIDRAKAAYDEVIGWWETAKNQPVHNPYSEYAAQAKANYNAISVPAYSDYTSTLNALRSQGCQVVQTYADSSWR